MIQTQKKNLTKYLPITQFNVFTRRLLSILYIGYNAVGFAALLQCWQKHRRLREQSDAPPIAASHIICTNVTNGTVALATKTTPFWLIQSACVAFQCFSTFHSISKMLAIYLLYISTSQMLVIIMGMDVFSFSCVANLLKRHDKYRVTHGNHNFFLLFYVCEIFFLEM